jgi:hypothetical protein
MAAITEIAPNIYRISIFAPSANIQFKRFLIKDDEPLLFLTGLRRMQAENREAVAKARGPACRSASNRSPSHGSKLTIF